MRERRWVYSRMGGTESIVGKEGGGVEGDRSPRFHVRASIPKLAMLRCPEYARGKSSLSIGIDA